MRAHSRDRKRRCLAELNLSVLGYLEDGEWVALALDMDLRGYGETFKGARDELVDLVNAQFGIAALKQQPELIWHPAEPEYWKMYELALGTSDGATTLATVIRRKDYGRDPAVSSFL